MNRTRVLFAVLLLSVVIAITAWSREITYKLKDNKGHFASQKTWEESSLSIAIRNNDTGKIESLINDGWDVNSPDENHFTALHYAIMKGDEDFIKFLLKHGADVNYSDFIISPLGLAANNNDTKLIKLLLLNGAEITGSEHLSLHALAGKGNIEAIELYISHGAEIDITDAGGMSPIFQAIYDRNIGTIKTLIKYNANVNHQDNSLLTPLHHATALGFNEAVKLLLEHGADLESKTKNDGSVPLHMAIIEGHKEIVKILLQHGTDVNALNKSNQTPLNIATYSLSAVQQNRQTVINSGEVTAEEIAEGIALIREITELLIEHGARINLHDAVLLEDMSCAKELLDKGAGINAQDCVQMTPLHYAVGTDQLEMSKYLLQEGADINIEAKNGMTPLDMASYKKQHELIELLEDYNSNPR